MRGCRFCKNPGHFEDCNINMSVGIDRFGVLILVLYMGVMGATIWATLEALNYDICCAATVKAVASGMYMRERGSIF